MNAAYFNNSEAEMLLLGAILNHNEVLDRHKVDRELFYEPSHKQIFDEIMTIRGRGAVADMPGVALALTAYTVQVASLSSFQLSDVAGVIKRLRDCVQARGAAKVVQVISEMQGDGEDPARVVEEATAQVMRLSEARDISYRTLLEVAADTVKEIDARRKCKDEYSGVSAGLEALDKMTDGFQGGDYILLGARPSIGKTALALTLAMNSSLKGERVGFMSLEMKDTALFKRILAAMSGVSMQSLRTGLLGPRAMSDLIAGASKIANAKIFFADVPNMNINDLVAEARILRSREKIGILIIDYIGLITAERGDLPRWDMVSEISRRLKSLARELNIPVLALAQLGRQADGKRPTLADLRDSGSLEQDADVIMFIHREEKSNEQKQPVKLIVAKQRNGETGDLDLMFDRSRMRFYMNTGEET